MAPFPERNFRAPTQYSRASSDTSVLRMDSSVSAHRAAGQDSHGLTQNSNLTQRQGNSNAGHKAFVVQQT